MVLGKNFVKTGMVIWKENLEEPVGVFLLSPSKLEQLLKVLLKPVFP